MMRDSRSMFGFACAAMLAIPSAHATTVDLVLGFRADHIVLRNLSDAAYITELSVDWAGITEGAPQVFTVDNLDTNQVVDTGQLSAPPYGKYVLQFQNFGPRAQFAQGQFRAFGSDPLTGTVVQVKFSSGDAIQWDILAPGDPASTSPPLGGSVNGRLYTHVFTATFPEGSTVLPIADTVFIPVADDAAASPFLAGGGLQVDLGTVTSEGELSVARVTAFDAGALAGRVQADPDLIFDLDFSGVFVDGALLTFSYDPDQISIPLADLVVWRLDDGGGFSILETVARDLALHTITVFTPGFSTFGIGARVSAGEPGVVALLLAGLAVAVRGSRRRLRAV